MSSFRDQLLNRAYNRVYTPGLVLGVNSYNRHNSEADRETLYDYSGNHRDIMLYDFDYKGMSGYEGFPEDFTDTKYSSITSYSTRTETKVISALSLNDAWIFGVNSVQYLLQPCWLKISGIDKSKISEDNHLVFLYVNPDNHASRTGSDIYEDGIYRYPGSLSLLDYEGESLQNAGLYFSGTYTSDQPIVVELLPEYPGGLISNGLNEYGECLQNFTLPTDYTILAIRKIIEPRNGGLSSKGGNQSPFLFEAGESIDYCSAWSYGSSTTVDRNPEDLFTYQTKESYNGQPITAGSVQDSEDNKLYLFKQNTTSDTLKAVLWDLRIYDHSLTSEELALVKDEMISNYQYATGDDYFRPKPLMHWDFSKYSNEDHPENILDLTGNGYDAAMTNFDFKGLSGYGGYAYDFSNFRPSTAVDGVGIWTTFVGGNNPVVPSTDGSKFTINYISDAATIVYSQPANGAHTGIDITFKVTGLDANSRILNIYPLPSKNSSRNIVKDGVYRYKITPEQMDENDIAILFYVSGPREGLTLPYPIVIEQLPLYPGSLVFDNSYISTVKAAYFPNRNGFTFIGKRRILDRNIRNVLFAKYLGTKDNARIIGDYINHNNNNNIYSYGGFKSIGILEDGILKFNSSTIGVGEYRDINKGTLEDSPNSPLSIGTYQKSTVDASISQGEGKFAVSEVYVFDRDLSKYQMDQFVSENMIPDPLVYYDIRRQDNRNGTNTENSLRNQIVDFSGNGNHGTLNSFSYAADSGWGTSYVDDEQGLFLSSDAGDCTFENHILTIQNHVGWILESPNANYPRYVKDFRIKISGLTQGTIQIFRYNKGNTIYQPFTEDGIYEIPGYKVEGYTNRSLGVRALGANNGVTVEFLPQTDYLQFALNNYVSFPDSLGSMKTIIAVVNVSTDGSVIYDSAQSGGNNIGIVHKADTVAYAQRNPGKNYINGIENKDVVCSSLLNKSVIATIVNEEDTSTLKYLGRSIDGSSSAIMKLYKFLGFAEALTESQIKRVIEKYSLMSGVDDIDVSGNFLNDIHYVADWDAKGRSNDEEGGVSQNG